MADTAERQAGNGRRPAKSPEAFRTISEVADDLDVPQHVLRFWETKFGQLRPLKRGGGRRYYRPEDIALLRRIRDLLYAEGYTIRGVQKLFREQSVSPAKLARAEATTAAAAPEPATRPFDDRRRAELHALLDELTQLRDMLRAAAGG